MKDLCKTVLELQDKGARPKDIAILVRTKNEGRIIANYILEKKRELPKDANYKLNLISSESLFLIGSPAINFIVNLMKIILDEQDEVAWVNIVYWRFYILKGDSENFEIQLEALRDVKQKANWIGLTGNQVAGYRSMPLNDLTEVLIRDFGLESIPGEHAFLTALQNIVLEYGANQNNDLFAFLQWWEEEGKTKSIKPSEQQDAIRIQTIHQSKGLEFRYVIIPYCSWELDHMPNREILWCKSENKILSKIPCFPVKYSKRLAETEFALQYYDELSMAYLDNLNLLYVALTRAETGLFIFAPKMKEKGTVNNVGLAMNQLFNALISGNGEMEDSEHCLSINDLKKSQPDILEIGDILDLSEDFNQATGYSLTHLSRSNWRKRITVRHQADFLLADDSVRPFEKVNYGILVHDVLADIIYREGAEEYLQGEVVAGKLPAELIKNILDFLNEIWRNEQIADWFSPNWTIKTEVPVLPESGQVSRMDRVMISGKKAILVDYKTGHPKPRDNEQVGEYMNILTKMGYENIDGYLLYLPTAELVKVEI
jgi:ATP-dependent exoDNAse (exonuclease V) beta subunit